MPVKGQFHPSPAQRGNLKNFGQMTKEEHLAASRLGGLNSAKVRREKREAAETFKTAAKWLLKQKAGKSDVELVEMLREQFPDLNNLEAMTASVVARAIKDGDYRAFQTLRDTTGELPEQTVNVKNEEPMTINIKTVE